MKCYQRLLFMIFGNVGSVAIAYTSGVTLRPQSATCILFGSMLAGAVLFGPCVHAESNGDPSAVLPAPPPMESPAPPEDGGRILGIIPNYQTVNDTSAPVPPLTARQKWSLALRETM